MLTSGDVKKIVLERGADLCGIASTDRFDEAPAGFHPRDVLPSCRSVIVFARKFLAGTLQCRSTVPYTIVRNLLSSTMDEMALQICYDLESSGAIAVPTGTIGPTELDPRTGRLRNIVSAKHCAVKAGLGRIGKNTLLVTPEYGNMVWLSALLTDAQLEADRILEGNPCLEGCNLCVDVCPVHALGDPAMKQFDCRNFAFGGENGGEWKIKCFKCREVCPNCLTGPGATE